MLLTRRFAPGYNHLLAASNVVPLGGGRSSNNGWYRDIFLGRTVLSTARRRASALHATRAARAPALRCSRPITIRTGLSTAENDLEPDAETYALENNMNDFRLELKVCEGCGALWLRRGV